MPWWEAKGVWPLDSELNFKDLEFFSHFQVWNFDLDIPFLLLGEKNVTNNDDGPSIYVLRNIP